MSASSKRPLLALDVDGVLCPLGKRRGESASCPPGFLSARLGRQTIVHYDPALPGWLSKCAELAELAWVSSWGARANQLLVPLWEMRPALVLEPGLRALKTAGEGRALVWLDDARINPAAKQWAKERREPSLLLAPSPTRGLTSRQRKDVLIFLRKNSGRTPLALQ